VYRDFNRSNSIASVFVARSERLARDADVVAVCSGASRAETDAPLAFESVEPLLRGRGRLSYAVETASFAARARRRLLRLRDAVDVVHAVGFATTFADLVTVNAVRKAEIAHYFEHVEPSARLRRRLTPLLRPQSLVVLAIERRLFRAPSPYCITHSEAIANDLVRNHGVPRDAVEAIPTGVDTRRFAGHPQAGAATRSRLGTAPDAFVVLFVGDDFERKGLDRAIRALRPLGPPSELWVVGNGPEETYATAVSDLPSRHRVRFLGRVAHEDLPDVYAGADTVILPSRQDSWGHPVLEGLAAGAVVLVSEFSGAHEVVCDGVDGFVLERDGSPEQAAAILGELAESRPARRAIGERARQKAAQYDVELLYERFHAAHRKAYERRLARAARRGEARSGSGSRTTRRHEDTSLAHHARASD
jgi:glycosyltransferase involved in cell wall biosynthesis